jgi:hypothetical protein
MSSCFVPSDLFDMSQGSAGEPYSGSLLVLAEDLGKRLLRAFDSPTGVPFTDVNLRSGVRRGSSSMQAAAGGALLIEFAALSEFSGRDRYRAAAERAVEAIWSRRSEKDLIGKHIDVTVRAN